jgi:hypothetical protein
MAVVILVVLAVIGYYRGWFHAESHDSGGQRSVVLTVDKGRLEQDKASLQHEVQDLGHTDATPTTAERPSGSAPSPK